MPFAQVLNKRLQFRLEAFTFTSKHFHYVITRERAPP